jgi:hypothetical protein
MEPTSTPTAYSYIRFSSPEQAKGDSLRRQTEAALAWCEGNGASLDTSITFHDLGKKPFQNFRRPGRRAETLRRAAAPGAGVGRR